MKAGWHILVAQIKLGNISWISDLNLHTDRLPQISLLLVCCNFFLYFFFPLNSVLVTNPLARTVREDFKGPVPQTAAEFASTFLASQISVANRMDMDAYFKECVGHPERALAYKQSALAEHATTQRKGSPYTISIPMQARAVMLRRLQILRGNFITQLIVLMYVYL
jgi:hypothetical protein